MATAGGLLFVGRNDGRLIALDSSNGKQLWEFQTGAGMHAAVSTFELKGKQYVLAYSGGSALIGSARGDSVWLFGLEGKLGPVQPGTPVPRNAAATSEAPRATVAANGGADSRSVRLQPDLDEGKRIFTQTCVACHGTDGKGDHGGASLVGVKDLDPAIATVTAGRNAMPSFRSSFTPEQIRDVSAYILQTFAVSK
jgi:mono/diheme cytochrome c family protein